MYLALYRLANPATVLEAFIFRYNFRTVPAFAAENAAFEEHCCIPVSLENWSSIPSRLRFFIFLMLRLLPSVRMSSVDSYRIKRVQFFGRKVRLLKILKVVTFSMFAINHQPHGLFSTRS